MPGQTPLECPGTKHRRRGKTERRAERGGCCQRSSTKKPGKRWVRPTGHRRVFFAFIHPKAFIFTPHVAAP
ncbi:hypothetical protein I553_7392 [Mycobacterium xenopi 4042]|uniref:Uncharacterized protein n=1 Tax=Mycobacterium xenopi 4042 TaxID=1299334 RepID=X8E9E2_MYCXE|nr:hypothetical protein I553_7392 [Mycobacterium xenopi 4042]